MNFQKEIKKYPKKEQKKFYQYADKLIKKIARELYENDRTTDR